jgi:hypothetical protein
VSALPARHPLRRRPADGTDLVRTVSELDGVPEVTAWSRAAGGVDGDDDA